MKQKYKVNGMTCAACSSRVEKVTKNIPEVSQAEVNLLAGTMVVTSSEDVSNAVIAAVSNAGYEASLWGETSKAKTVAPSNASDHSRLGRLIASAVFLIVLMYFTMGHMLGIPVPEWYYASKYAMVAALLQFMLTIPVIILNLSYYTRGFKALYNRSPNMDSLVAVGSGASLVYGVIVLFRIAVATGNGDWEGVQSYKENLYFESAAMILTLISLGKYLENRAKGKTGDAIRQLLDLAPKTATVRIDGEEKVVSIDQIQVGDIVLVRSGATIPVDGTVISGHASIDQSALTGESVPVDKAEGDTVAAATINTAGYIEVRADKVGEDTTLSQVIRLVEEAGGSKAPIARLADKIAGIFVPTIMLIATVTFAVWMIAGKNFEFSLNAAISVLVISCPCALGLATPVAIMVGTGRGARMGVLFKNAESLENLHKIDTIVFDKTGTVTVGKPTVTDILPNLISESELLQLAASLEEKSEHPFAKAIMLKAGDIERFDCLEFETLPGHGVCGVIHGKKYYGGNRALMKQLDVAAPDHSALAREGKTPLYFACEDKTYLGAIVAADVIKEDSALAVMQLIKQKVNVIMLTGDNESTARSIAAKAGITNVIADVLPAQKAGVIQKLKDEGHNVLMVGDGINDAPALITANVGMAIGAGTDIAVEAADVVLMNHSLMGVSNAVALSKATIRNIRQNLFWAFFYNILGIPVAAGVLYPAFGILLSPMIGAAAMSFSSVFVVTNALRLRFFKPRTTETHIEPIIKEENTMETIIKVEGMMCTHCKARVENVCKGAEGVTDAVVDLERKQVTVYGKADVEALKGLITDAGYEVIG